MTSTLSSTDRWPLTRRAWRALSAEAALLARSDAGAGERRQLALLRSVLDAAEVVDDPRIAAIGRRVTLRENDGSRVTYKLVLPGDGDPGRGWLAGDSPMGMALLGARPGEVVTIDAPAGVREVQVEAVS